MPTLRPRALVPALLVVLSVGCGGGTPDDTDDVDAAMGTDGGDVDGGGDSGSNDTDAGSDAGVDAYVPPVATLSADEANHPVGELLLNASGSADLVFRNLGGLVTGTLTTSLVGDTSLTIGTDGCDGTTLDPAESCTVHLVASSAVEATGNATVSVTASPGGTVQTTVSVSYVRPFELELDDVDATHDFGNRLVGSSASKVVRVTNVGGQVSPTLGALQTTNAAYVIAANGCSGTTLDPNEHCEFTITYSPSAPGATSGATTVVAGATSLPFAVSGFAQSPAALRLEASAASFASTLIGATSTTITYELWNDGDVDSGVVATSLSGSDAGHFEVMTDACDGEVVAPDTHCDLTVRFAPTGTRGQKQASLNASASPGGMGMATLSGIALADAVFTETEGPHDFGVEPVGGISASNEFLVMNDGDVVSGAVTVTLGGANPDQFHIGAGSCSAPVPDASGCSVHVTFRPTRFGPASATITVTGTPGGTLTFDVSGTGEDFLYVWIDLPLAGGGAGTVTGSGLSCPGSACGVAVSRTTANPTVTLTATPAASSDFIGWSGACASFGTAPECTLTLSTPTTNVGLGFELKVYDVVLLVNEIAGRKGTITSTTSPSSGVEFDCGTTCQVSVTHGTTIDLVATPEAGAYFGGFGGGCVSTGRTCSFTVTESSEIEVAFTPANRMFTTPLTYTVSETKAFATDTTSEATRMLTGADAICRSLGGSNDFYAFLGAVGVSPYTRIPGSPRGFVRADGRPFKAALTHTSAVYYPPSIDQTGAAVSNISSSHVWSGVGPSGTTTNSTTCGDWNFVGNVSIGPFEGVGTAWSSYANGTCNGTTRHHFVCLEALYQADVTPAPAPPTARYVFVSNGIYDPSTGLAGADAICDAEAAPSLPGTYRAVIATSTASMSSRFTADARPIHLSNGLFVATSSASLLSTTLPLAPIGIDATGGTIDALVWIGANDPNLAGTTATTCYTAGGGSWSTNGSGVSGSLGTSSQRDRIYSGAWFPCNWGQAHVYCLEE